MALLDQAAIEPPPNRRTAGVRTKPEAPSLISSECLRVSRAGVPTAALHGAALSVQSAALAHLIDDLLKAETGPEATEESGLAEPRLPGENANDTLRYLLRGLRRELGHLDKDLRGNATSGAVSAQRLDRVQQFAVGVVGALRNVPSSGAGDAVTALIGGFLDRAGLLPWNEFLSHCPTALREAPARPAAGQDKAHLSQLTPGPVEDAKPAFAKSAPATIVKDDVPSVAESPVNAEDALPHPVECEAEDPLEIPLMLVRPIQGDWARVLLKKGLGYLTKCYGEPAETLKPLLKTWLAQSGDDHKKVFKLIAEAQARNEPDPKSWVGRHLVQQAPA